MIAIARSGVFKDTRIKRRSSGSIGERRISTGAYTTAEGTFAYMLPRVLAVKRLWTDSFTFFSTGWVLLLLIAFYWLIDVKQVKRWAFPFLVLGMNSIFIYSLGQIGIKGWLNRGLQAFTGNFKFLGQGQ